MKKIFTILLVVFAITANAQSVPVQKDTVLPNAIQILPIIVTAQGDTATQVGWYAFDVQRDSVSGCNTNVSLYNRKGVKLYSYNQPIPAAILNQWADDPTPIDDYIFSQNLRLVRKPEL